MAEEKVHAPQTLATSLHVPVTEIEEETDAVLLDIGAAKLENGEYGSLKLAKDGHVWALSSMS